MHISDFYRELDRLFRTNQIDRVEPFLLQQIVAANQERDPSAVLAVLNELVGFYRSQKRYDEAIRVAHQALDLCGHEYILGSIAHATTLLNGATAYRFSGQPEKAMEWFLQAEDYAGLYNNMSAACSDLGQNDRAAEYLQRAAAIMDALPERAVQAAVTHANLASLYAKLQRWAEAKEQIARACALLQDRPEAAAQYAQFRAMQDAFARY